jgi:DNA-binding SARP family transcriptional activator
VTEHDHERPTVALEFRILGSLQVRAGGREVSVGGPRQRAVLATLLLAPGRVVSVDALMDQVWKGRPPPTGRAQIAICVAGLRKAFRAAGCERPVIVTAPPGYLLSLDGHRLDAAEFTRRAAAAQETARWPGREAEAADLLQEALAMWRGPALADVYAHSAEVEATRLGELRMQAVEARIALGLALGRHRDLVGELTGLVRADPLREQLRGHLMLALHRSGRRAEALKVFQEGRRICVEELGLEPGAGLCRLHESILRDADAVAAPTALASAGPARRRPAQLPSDVAAFVGRRAELAAMDGALTGRAAGGPVPVCFVTGGPGVGKSGLALHWARRAAASFPDGQLYADLREPDENGAPVPVRAVLHRFLRALGVPPQGLPTDPHECGALYRSLLDDRRVLVVLDNAASYDRVHPLLPGGGRCGVVVTGSGALGELDGAGALRVRLGPLDPSDAAGLLALLVRDGRTADDPPATARLADLCGRLPLTLRAAAARLAAKPHWQVPDLVARLADPARRLPELGRGDGSLRARLDSVVRSLEPAHRRAVGCLGVAGPPEFDASTGAALLGVDVPSAEDVLEQLVDAQLLQVAGRDGGGRLRYRFEELIRLHAAGGDASRFRTDDALIGIR